LSFPAAGVQVATTLLPFASPLLSSSASTCCRDTAQHRNEQGGAADACAECKLHVLPALLFISRNLC
jgi:hypothetical protein